MRRINLIFCAILACSMLFAKDIERVSITYEYVSNNPNETPAEAEKKAFEQAKMKALEDKFGLDVSSVTSTLIANRSGSGDDRSQNNVFSLGETFFTLESIFHQLLEAVACGCFFFLSYKALFYFFTL